MPCGPQRIYTYTYIYTCTRMRMYAVVAVCGAAVEVDMRQSIWTSGKYDMDLRIYICIYTYIYMCVYIYNIHHIYMHVCVHIYIYTYICMCVYTHMYINVNKYIYIYMYVCRCSSLWCGTIVMWHSLPESQYVLSCRSLFAKEPSIIRLFCRKWHYGTLLHEKSVLQ